MAEAVGCARPTGAQVGGTRKEPASPSHATEEESPMEHIRAQVGKHAPDFEAPAYHQGKFGTAKLSQYLGKWTLLCFYPGDFTFV